MVKQIRRRFAIAAVCLMGFLGFSGAAGAGGRAAMPANVHPAVAEAMRAVPGGFIRVIVSRTPGAAAEAGAEALGARVTARWPFINAFAAEVPARKVAALASLPGVRAVLRDNPVAGTGKGSGGGTGGDSGGGDSGGGIGSCGTVTYSAPVNSFVYSIRANYAWEKGYKGQGITVAVVDSGMTPNGQSDFGNRVVGGVSLNPAVASSNDLFGHGTHVAGIIGGDGYQCKGKYMGVAPAVNLLNVKFSADDGTATEKDLVNALQWVYDNRVRYNIRVANISSTVGTQTSYKESPTAAAVEQLWNSGVVIVVSAGNRGGEACSTCYAPANDPYVISVGAVDDMDTTSVSDDFPKSWSSSGPTKDLHVKPDLVAPGARIVAYMPSGQIKNTAAGNVVDSYYFRMGGTSMAAPMVSGAVALLLQAKPNLTPNQVKWVLQSTARAYTGQPAGTGGIVDVNGAIRTAKLGEANVGLTPSPFLNGTGSISYSDALWANALWANALWANNLGY